MTTIYVVESVENGITCAFNSLDDAKKYVLKAWVQEIPTMYNDYSFDGCNHYAVDDIKRDFSSLMDEGYIDEYVYIYDVDLLGEGEADA